MRNLQYWSFGLFLAACSATLPAIAAPPATTQTTQPGSVLIFDPSHGHRIASNDKWVAWSIITPDLNPKYRFSHAGPPYFIKYFVQPLDSNSPPVQLLDSAESGGHPEKFALLNDGWLLSNGGGARLAWMANPPVNIHRLIFHDGEIGHFSVFPDGVMTVTSEFRFANGGATRHLASSVWWLPIVGHHIDAASKELLEDDAGDNGIAMNFVRHRDEIVWLDATRTQDKVPQPPRLYIFDALNKTVRNIEVTGEKFTSDERIDLFDGVTALDGNITIDIASGKTRRFAPINGTFGLKDGVIYSTSETQGKYQLIATKLDDIKSSHLVSQIDKGTFGAGVKVVRVNGDLVGVDPKDLFLVADDGVRAWNGRTWANLR